MISRRKILQYLGIASVAASTMPAGAQGRDIWKGANRSFADGLAIAMSKLQKGEFIEKGVRPPMGADPELKNEPYSIMPGQVTFYRSTDF